MCFGEVSPLACLLSPRETRETEKWSVGAVGRRPSPSCIKIFCSVALASSALKSQIFRGARATAPIEYLMMAT